MLFRICNESTVGLINQSINQSAVIFTMKVGRNESFMITPPILSPTPVISAIKNNQWCIKTNAAVA